MDAGRLLLLGYCSQLVSYKRKQDEGGDVMALAGVARMDSWCSAKTAAAVVLPTAWPHPVRCHNVPVMKHVWSAIVLGWSQGSLSMATL